MAVTTRLTWLQEKRLQNCFGEKKFSLLYKATVHEFFCEELLQRCCNQGPTLTVTYSEDYIVGAYMEESYSISGGKKGSIVLFAFQDIENSEFEVRLFEFRDLFEKKNYYLQYGNSKFIIHPGRKQAKVSFSAAEKLGLPQANDINIQECEVFRCEDLLDKRKIDGVTVLRDSLLSALKTYKPYKDLVHQVRILLLGPVGAGKSSFFNSVKSVFRGYVTNQALVGLNTTGISEQYRTYSIRDGKNGYSLPFILCDSMGLGEKEEGLCMDDIPYILQGHVPDRYQFNSVKPITPSHHGYIDSPLLKDRIHCVTFVFDANSVADFSHEMVAKIKRIRKELIKYGMVHVALLTHVDAIDLITKGDLIDIYRCVPVKFKIEAVHRKLGFPISNILVVSSYTSEWELDPIKDVLILSALKQMLRVVDDFLEDLPFATDITGREEQNVQKEKRNK